MVRIAVFIVYLLAGLPVCFAQWMEEPTVLEEAEEESVPTDAGGVYESGGGRGMPVVGGGGPEQNFFDNNDQDFVGDRIPAEVGRTGQYDPNGGGAAAAAGGTQVYVRDIKMVQASLNSGAEPRRKEMENNQSFKEKVKGAGSMNLTSREINGTDWGGKAWGGKKTVGYGGTWKSCEINLPRDVEWESKVESDGKKVGSVYGTWDASYIDMLKGELEKLITRAKEGQASEVIPAGGSPTGAQQNPTCQSNDPDDCVLVPDKEFNETARQIKEFGNYIQKCQGLLFAGTHSDFSGSSYDDKVSQVNPKLKCIAREGETQDYKACVKMVNMHDGFYLARQVNSQVQQVRGQLHGEKVQEEVLDKMGKGDNTASALKGQKDLLKKREQFAKERMVLSSTEAATLEVARRAMPTMENLLADCRLKMRVWQNEFKSFVEASTNQLHQVISRSETAAGMAAGETGAAPNQFVEALLDPEDACVQIEQRTNLILNTQARQIVAHASIKAGIDAAANLAAAKLLGDRAKSINSVVKKIDSFKPVTPTGLADYIPNCDPRLTHCRTTADADEGQTVGFDDATFHLGGDARATQVGGSGSEYGSGSGHFAGGTGSSSAKALSSVDRSNINHAGGFAGDPPDAAVASNKGGSLPGGGGGGGAPSGGGGSSGGIGGGRGGGSAGGDGDTGVKVAYAGTGSNLGKYSARGGRGSRRSSRKAASNPFSKLFNKNKGKSNNNIVNFRGLASNPVGDEGGNIFKIISRGYQKAMKKKLLLEYEKKN